MGACKKDVWRALSSDAGGDLALVRVDGNGVILVDEVTNNGFFQKDLLECGPHAFVIRTIECERYDELCPIVRYGVTPPPLNIEFPSWETVLRAGILYGMYGTIRDVAQQLSVSVYTAHSYVSLCKRGLNIASLLSL